MNQNQVIKKFETTLYGYQELVTDLLSEHGMKPAQFLGMALNTVKRDNDESVGKQSKVCIWEYINLCGARIKSNQGNGRVLAYPL